MKEELYIRHPVRQAIQINELVTIHYFEYGKDYTYPGESHNFWEIMCADRGSIRVRCGNTDHVLSRGDMILLPPNHFHALHSDDTTPFNLFIISFTETSGALLPLGGRVFRMTSPMKELIRAILREGKSTFVLPMPKARRNQLQPRADAPFGGEQLIKLWLEQLLILLYRESTIPGTVETRARYDDDIAGRILLLLKQNLCEQLTLADITRSLGYGKTHLSNVFKRVYGQSIMEHYEALKIDEAKYLLRDGTMSIAQISDHLGFSSPQYFSKRFSKLVKMSPRQYASSLHQDWVTTTD
jgi:AraC-like DNA-binding protein